MGPICETVNNFNKRAELNLTLWLTDSIATLHVVQITQSPWFGERSWNMTHTYPEKEDNVSVMLDKSVE